VTEVAEGSMLSYGRVGLLGLNGHPTSRDCRLHKTCESEVQNYGPAEPATII